MSATQMFAVPSMPFKKDLLTKKEVKHLQGKLRAIEMFALKPRANAPDVRKMIKMMKKLINQTLGMANWIWRQHSRKSIDRTFQLVREAEMIIIRKVILEKDEKIVKPKDKRRPST